MAPVIWGLNLGDMKWSMFGSKWMWKNKDYHLRRTKFIIYQLAMINMVVSESIGTAALSGKYFPHDGYLKDRPDIPSNRLRQRAIGHREATLLGSRPQRRLRWHCVVQHLLRRFSSHHLWSRILLRPFLSGEIRAQEYSLGMEIQCRVCHSVHHRRCLSIHSHCCYRQCLDLSRKRGRRTDRSRTPRPAPDIPTQRQSHCCYRLPVARPDGYHC